MRGAVLGTEAVKAGRRPTPGRQRVHRFGYPGPTFLQSLRARDLTRPYSVRSPAVAGLASPAVHFSSIRPTFHTSRAMTQVAKNRPTTT